VLILRDVLGFPAAEVAGMLDSSVDSVNSALKRARAGLRERLPQDVDALEGDAIEAHSDVEEALVARFVAAYESADVPALIGLLTEDAFMAMPPMPLEYIGRDLVGEFCGLLFAAGRRFTLVPTRANGQPAFGAYLALPGGRRQCTSLLVLGVSGDRISELIRFETTVLPYFGLPRTLPPVSP
jgi:RNA polymerase sigma-70 factor (ECF subfamily)